MSESGVVSLLGGAQAIGHKVERDLDFDEEIKKGFRSAVLVSFKKNTKLSNGILSRAMGVSPKSVERILGSKAVRLKPALSDRLYRTAKIVACAERALDDRLQAMQWLEVRQAGLGDRIPMELLETDAGAREVEEELARIEHGFTA
jgi:putative toxin-antitoxin system antitoxin component (TIGR02293 family)